MAMLVAIVTWGLGNILIKQTSIDGLNVAFYRLWFGTALMLVSSSPPGIGSRCAN